MAIPTTMRALKVRGPDDVFIDYTAKVPSPPPHYVLAKVSYIALNPTDWKAASRFSADVPHTLGCDAVGRIAAVGDEGSEIYKLGDRVAGLCYGLRLGVPESGAFGEYCLFKMGLSLLVPDNVTDEEAATIPVGTNIVGQGAREHHRYKDELMLMYSLISNPSSAPSRARSGKHWRAGHTHLWRQHRYRTCSAAVCPTIWMPGPDDMLPRQRRQMQSYWSPRGFRLSRSSSLCYRNT